jgi:hypothetical protein
MKQIEEVEQSLVDYRGVSLLQCGRYIFDGELRVRASDQSAAKPKSVCCWIVCWVTLFIKPVLGGLFSLIR